MAVRLPDETALGKAPGLATSRRIAPAVPSAIELVGPALERTLEKVAGTFEKRENDQEAFDATARFVDFQDQQNKALLERQKTAPPGAADFGKTAREEYTAAAKGFFQTIPGRLQPEFDVRLRSLESRVTNAANQFETEEGKRHAVGQIDDTTRTIERRVYDSPADIAAAIAEHDRLVDANPRLTAPEKEEIKRKNRVRLQGAGEMGKIDKDIDYARSVSESGYGNKPGSTGHPVEYENNISNLIKGPTAWTGKGKPYFNKAAGVEFETFATPEQGVAAGYKNVLYHVQNSGVKTFDDLGVVLLGGKVGSGPIKPKRPLGGNDDSRAWATSVAGSVGLKPGDPIPVNDLQAMAKVMKGINIIEQGRQTVPDAAYIAGVTGQPMPAGQGAAPSTAGTAPAPPGVRRLVAPEGMPLDMALKLRSYGEHRVKQLTDDLNDYALTTQQDVLLGRQEPGALTGVAQQYRRLGLGAQATYYDYLASKPDLIKQWSQAGSEEQRAIILSSRAPLNAAASVSEDERKRIRGALNEARTDLAGSVAADIKRMSADLLSRGKSMLSTAEDDLKAKAPVEQVMPRLQEAFSIAKATGDRELLEKVEKVAGQYRASEALRGMPTSVQEGVLERARNELARDGGAPGQTALTQKLEDEHRKYVTDLGKDPWSAGTDRFSLAVQPLPDIRTPTPQTIDALRTRAAQAQAVLAKEPTTDGKLVPFSDEEMALISAAFDKAPANQKAVMLGTMAAGLGPDWFAKTMKVMADKGNGALAWSGGLMSTDSTAGRLILEGVEVRKANKNAVPGGSDLTTAVDEAVGTTFQNSPSARATVGDAVQAAYAKIAFDAGKTDGKYDADIAAKAIRTVIGTVVSYRGQNVIPPRRDMGSAEFRDVVDRLQDSDLPDLRTMEGDKIDAARIKRYGALSSAGDGRYTVRMADRGGVLHDVVDPTTGKTFILDVRPLMARAPEGYVPRPVSDFQGSSGSLSLTPAAQPPRSSPESRKRANIPLPSLAPPLKQPDDGPDATPEGYERDILRMPPPGGRTGGRF